MSWGLWRLPERQLNLLGPTRSRDILELGCGAGRWAVALDRLGAHVIALDFSRSRLRQAAATIRRGRAEVPLVEADAQALPFAPESFDIVFCDWGALTFADPHRAIPEAARVLRAGGLLVFSTSSPFRSVCHDRVKDRIGDRLLYDYFGLHRIDFSDETDYNLPYGEWVRLFWDHGLHVERLLETRPSRGSKSSYLGRRDNAWARRWPLEAIWKVRKVAGGRT